MDKFTPEIQDALMNLFSSEGWHYFLEDVVANLESVNNLDGIQGEQALGFRQGQISTLRGVISYEDTIKAAAEDASDDVEESQLEVQMQ